MSEIVLRRKANRIGYRITKGFQHCGGGVSLDQNGDRMPGYMILDQYSNFVIAGTNDAFDYCLSFDEVKDILKDMYQRLGISW